MPLTLVQTVPPTAEPLGLPEVKQHLRVEHDSEDALLYLYMQAAREQAELVTRRQCLTATYTLSLDCFPRDQSWRWHRNQGLLLPRPPLQSVTEVRYLDTSGVAQILATSVYGVDTLSQPGRLYLKTGQSWPSVSTQLNAVTITYVAGWPTYAAVPGPLKMAILLLVGHFYEHREASVEKALELIPLGVTQLLWGQRIEVV